MRREFVNFHIHILFCIIGLEKKNGPTVCGCVFLRANQSGIKILHRESHYQNNGQNITIQTNVKTSHSQSHWQKMIIGCIFFKTLQNIFQFGSHSSLYMLMIVEIHNHSALSFITTNLNSIISLMFNIINTCH